MSFFTTYDEPESHKLSTTIIGKVFDVIYAILCVIMIIISLPSIILLLLVPIAVILHLFGVF